LILISVRLAAADRSSDRIEAKAHIIAQAAQRCDEHDGDQSSNQPILNRSGSRLALTELLHKLFHWTFPSDMRGSRDSFLMSYLRDPAPSTT